MWPSRVSAIVEPSTFCNARCPQCSRTASRNTPIDNPGPAKKFDWLPTKNWTYKEFAHMFRKETLDTLTSIHFSGTYGDPGMNPHLPEMAKHIHDNDGHVTVNSNGSMHDENWWWKLGLYCDCLTFDIDGINQEMHAKYRRGTDLKKVITNIKAALESNATVKIFTVIFKHNEDYIDDIKKMMMDVGVKEKNFSAVESNRFTHGPVQSFINEDGEVEYLEQTNKKEFYRDRHTLHRRTRDHRDDINSYNTIECVTATRGSVQIYNDGMVYPCCYIGGPMSKDKYIGKISSHLNHPVTNYIRDNAFLFNLKYHTLPEILNNIWFTKTLKESFTDNPVINCRKFCGKCV